MKTRSGRSRSLIGATLGGLLLAGTLVGCGSDSLALRAATVPTPAAVVSGAATGSGQGARAGGALVQVQPAPISAVGVASAAPAGVSLAVPNEPATAAPAGAQHGIQVTGNGEIQARPDQAIVDVGVQTRATTAQEAQANNNTTMQAVINAIKTMNVPDKDIRTSGVSLYPIIEQNNLVSGYNASNSVIVTVENIDQTGAVLDAAVKAGANTSTSVRFGFKNETTLRNQALAAAAADAKSKAQALASALGLQISGVESVTEGQVIIPRPFIAAAGVRSAAAAPSVPIEPGQQSVTAEVTVVFGY
ncbi:MAG: SIMPL domain-containing protein [Chloroflexota bacterium]